MCSSKLVYQFNVDIYGLHPWGVTWYLLGNRTFLHQSFSANLWRGGCIRTDVCPHPDAAGPSHWYDPYPVPVSRSAPIFLPKPFSDRKWRDVAKWHRQHPAVKVWRGIVGVQLRLRQALDVPSGDRCGPWSPSGFHFTNQFDTVPKSLQEFYH